MTTTHIMSDETGQLILAQLQAISQALDDGALSNSQIDTVLADQSPTGAGFLDGGGLKRFFDGLQAQFAAISHNHSGDNLTPASVTATGAIQGSSISDGTGTLAELRESVYHKANDTISLRNYTAPGFVTSGSSLIFFEIITPKLLGNITSVTITSLTGGLRGNKGYVDGTSDASNLKSSYSITSEITGPNSIRIVIQKSGSSFSNVDNNTPVTAPLTGVIQLQ